MDSMTQEQAREELRAMVTRAGSIRKMLAQNPSARLSRSMVANVLSGASWIGPKTAAALGWSVQRPISGEPLPIPTGARFCPSCGHRLRR